jgi:hypothetical protein
MLERLIWDVVVVMMTWGKVPYKSQVFSVGHVGCQCWIRKSALKVEPLSVILSSF